MPAINSRMIGVEIGSNTLKMAVVSGGQVKKMAVKAMPEDLVREGRLTSANAMTQFLKDMMKENGIRGGSCALVLPSHRPRSPCFHARHVRQRTEAEPALRIPRFRGQGRRQVQLRLLRYGYQGECDGALCRRCPQ